MFLGLLGYGFFDIHHKKIIENIVGYIISIIIYLWLLW